MRVGVNSRLLLKDKLEGIGYFTLKNLERLTKNHPECEFVLFFDRPYDKDFVFADVEPEYQDAFGETNGYKPRQPRQPRQKQIDGQISLF